MIKRRGKLAGLRGNLLGNWQFPVLCLLLIAVFLMGGASRGDVTSLVILRPLAIICLGLGLFGLTRDHWRAYRMPLGLMAAILALILLHLVPLPPFIWTNVPGREVAVEAGTLVGLEQIWRPLSLVPYRGWNSFYAMLVPAAALVLAVQLSQEQHRTIFRILLILIALAGVLAIVQTGSGFNSAFYPYRVTNTSVPTGLFANRNHFAALLCVALPMLALLGSRAKGANKVILQVVCAGGALVALLLIFVTGSRSGLGFAILALAAGWLVWTGQPVRVQHHTGKKLWIGPAFGIAAAVFVVTCLAVIFVQADALDRLVDKDPVEEKRFIVWRVTAASAIQYLPMGSGIGSFVEIFQMHEPADMLEFNYWNHAHNDWLEWILEGGVAAAIILLVALVAWVRQTRDLARKLYSGQFAIQLGVVGAAVILILGLWSLVDYPLRVPSLACLAAVAAVWMTAPKAARRPVGPDS